MNTFIQQGGIIFILMFQILFQNAVHLNLVHLRILKKKKKKKKIYIYIYIYI